MTQPSQPIIEVAYSQEAMSWNVSMFWPGEQHRAPETYGTYRRFKQARDCATGVALKATEAGDPSPQIIVIAGVLWGKQTAF
jgi:hypothetical protein